MAKVSSRRRVLAYTVVAAVFGGIALIVFPVFAYSGPGPNANRDSRLNQCLLSAWDYARAHDGRLPASLCPEGPDLAPLAFKHLPARRRLVEQQPVPPTFWNPALEGRNFENIDFPSQTILYFEGADNQQGDRMVIFVDGGRASVPAPVVTDAVLRHDGVLSSIYLWKMPASQEQKRRRATDVR